MLTVLGYVAKNYSPYGTFHTGSFYRKKMHNKKALLLSVVLGFLPYAWAGELTSDQESLKVFTSYALLAEIPLKYGMVYGPLKERLSEYMEKEGLQSASVEKLLIEQTIEESLAIVNELMDNGVMLPDNEIEKMRVFGQELEIMCLEQSAQVVVPVEQQQLLGEKPEPIINLDDAE